MLLTEFDMKQYTKSEREVWKEEGREEGREEGEQRLSTLIQLLIRDNRQEDITKVISDSTYRKLLYEEYGLMD